MSPICAAIIAEHAARRAGVALLLAAAERRVRFVDDDHHRAHRAQHRQHALEVAFGLADVLRAEVLEHHARHADLAADALRQERLAGADRAAEQIAHRQLSSAPRFSSAASSRSRAFAASWPTTVSSVHFGSMNSSRPRHCRSSSRFFSARNTVGVEPLAALARRLDQHVEIGERDAGGQRGELARRRSRRTPSSGASAVGAAMNALALGFVGQRHFDRRDVRVAGRADR